MEVNPFEAPECRDAIKLPPSAHQAHRDLRKDIEGVVAIAATMLLAGAWAGSRYLGAPFLLVLMTVTVGFLVGVIVYAVAAKRLRVLLFLPVVLPAIVGQELVPALFILAGVIGIPIAVLFSFIRPTRQNWILTRKMVLIGLTSIASLVLTDRLRLLGARRTAERAEVLIEAIDRFQTREGKLPSSLNDLVPHDVSSIPDTGMARFPSFDYVVPTSQVDVDEQRLFATYELRVNLYRLLQFDSLVYWPEGNYPDAIYGGGVERIGDWAYVHE